MAIVMTMTGRTVALDELYGEGVETLPRTHVSAGRVRTRGRAWVARTGTR